MPLTKKVSALSKSTGSQQEVDGLLSGVAWNDIALNGVVTYSFPNDTADYGKGYSEAGQNFEAFTSAQQAASRSILWNVEAVTQLSFFDLTDPVDAKGKPVSNNDKDALIRFGETDKTPEAWTYYPSEKANGGDAWFNNSDDLFEAPQPGTYAYAVFLHETGHALGLKHSFENGSFGTVPAETDSLEFTVMSYSSYPGAFDWLNSENDYPQTLMMYDIAALQHMYGSDVIGAESRRGGTVGIDPAYLNLPTDNAGQQTWNAKYVFYNPGDTTYTWTPENNDLKIEDVVSGTELLKTFAPTGTTIFLTIWDNGGWEDTYDFHAYTHESSLHIDLRPGQWTQTDILNNTQTAQLGEGGEGAILARGNIANALSQDPRSFIENAVGGEGDDELVANAGVNELMGGLGSDTLTWVTLDDLTNAPLLGSSIWDFDVVHKFTEEDRIDLTRIGLDSLDDIVYEYHAKSDTGLLKGNIDNDPDFEFTIRLVDTEVATASATWILV